MIRETSAFVQSVWDFIREQRQEGAFLLAGFMALIIFATSQLWGDVEVELTRVLAVEKSTLYLGLLWLGVFALAGYIFVQRARIIRKGRPGAGIEIPPPGERLRIEPIDTLPKLRQIQEVLVPAIFGSDTPPDDEVYKSFARNPRRSIGLYSDDLGRLVGFATIWPITANKRPWRSSQARSLRSSSRRRTSFRRRRTGLRARPSFRGSESSVRQKTGASGAASSCCSLFPPLSMRSISTRRVELIASGWSEDGCALCASIEMSPAGEFQHGGKSYPLFVKEIDASILRARQLHLV
jgi:hypothetical protein